MLQELETERLILRPLQLSDAARTQQLFGEWEIVKLLNASVKWPYTEGQALQYYRDLALPAMECGNEWHWTLRLKEAPSEHIGAIGLFRGEWDNRGFWVGLPWQGKGYMTEAAMAVNDYWFDTLGFDLLRTSKAAQNVASNRISEKMGMRMIREIEKDYVCGRLLTQVWEITAEEWRARRAGVLLSMQKARRIANEALDEGAGKSKATANIIRPAPWPHSPNPQ